MKIPIKGPIISDSEQFVYDWFGIPATSPSKVLRAIDTAINSNIKEITAVINSGGGSVYAASEIYTELKNFPGKVKIQITGLAASAASVIAQAGESEISPTGQFMIHNALVSAEGDYREMAETSDFLKKVNLSIINAYSAKTGKSAEELQVLMDAETFMTAQEAVDAGFIDSVMFSDELKAVANTEHPELVNGMLPPEVINKMREQLANENKLSAINSTGNEPKGADKEMDMEKLKAEHPDLYKEILNAGRTEGVNAERERIKEIENIAVVGSDDIINKAKFETGITAADTAMEILKAQKQKGATALNAAKIDAQPLNQVDPTTQATPGDPVDEDAELDKILNQAGKLKGAK